MIRATHIRKKPRIERGLKLVVVSCANLRKAFPDTLRGINLFGKGSLWMAMPFVASSIHGALACAFTTTGRALSQGNYIAKRFDTRLDNALSCCVPVINHTGPVRRIR